MVDWSGVGTIAMSWVSSGFFWMILTIVFTLGIGFLLWINKRRKLKYNVDELISFGNGKVGINSMRAGIFKKKTAVFGLWDYGNESVYKTNDGRTIFEATSDDLHDIRGKKGFIVRRKDDDARILVPISNISWRNEKAIFEIAPADFRDASVNIVNDATKETQGWAEKYLPYIMLAGIVIFFIISMILATQFFNRTVDKAGEILKQAGENAGAVASSTTAP